MSRAKDKKKKGKNISKFRFVVCISIVAVIFSAFIVRLFMWQIVNGETYRNIAVSSTSYTEKTDAPRGEILDRNGNGLTVNKTCYKIVLNRLYIDMDNINQIIERLVSYMDARGEKWQDVLPVIVSDSGRFSFKPESEQEVNLLKSEEFLNLEDTADASVCIEELAKRYNAENITDKKVLRNVLSVRYNMEKNSFSNTNPYDFALGISSEMVSIISENFQNISGVDVKTYLERSNPDPDIAPHLLGALGSISQEEYNEKTEQGKVYSYTDKIGKFGIESAFEDTLKGQSGTKIVEKNSDGTVVREVKKTDAKPGNTVYLTIDSKIQNAANKALEENVKAAAERGKSLSTEYGEKGYGEDCRAGAAVMLSVKDFSVLAAASYPSYDLEKYSEYSDYYVKLETDEDNSPLYDRVFNGTFAPGSIFKPCVACAALEEGVVTKDTLINCTKYYDYYKTDPVACMGTHGNLNIFSALTVSCNYFFAETGRRLGIDTMYLYAEKFGLGEKTGVEISESTGTLAGRDSTGWTGGNTVQAAIGQSDNTFTPVQLATYAATVANNGTRLKTHLVSKITDYQRKNVIEYNNPDNPQKVDVADISAENMELVQSAMRNVAASPEGTAYSVFGNYKVKIAAKTGTAENAGSDHTTFICYAPYDKPEVALAVVLEHGAKGTYSMNVAKAMLDAYFG